MFEHILDCPQCGKRFHYEHEGDIFPETIACPECGEFSESGEFEVLLLCHECHVKLKVPLPMLNDKDNRCPKCGAEIHNDLLSHLSQEAVTVAGASVAKEKKRMLNDGDIFDKYKIITLLGRGGMAEVYLAEHLLLKQKCALKLMQRSLDQDDTPVFIKRFVREAKLTHSLSHPNIVKVFDAGSDFKTGFLFLAMEYIEGETLHKLIQKKDFTEEELLEILTVTANALKVLENAKVVHRDIKPSNIMYTRDGVYKLMDLGVAKMESNHQAGDMTLTMEQSTIGTPGYASPEQCSSAHQVDVRSDIFSLGATLYHAATGFIPFEGDTPVAAILNTVQKEPESLGKLRPDLSVGFISLIEKMMKKKPSERFANVSELLQGIALVKRKRSCLSEKISTFFHSPVAELELQKKRKALCLKIALAAAAVAVCGAYFYFSGYSKKTESVPQSAAVSAPRTPRNEVAVKQTAPVPKVETAVKPAASKTVVQKPKPKVEVAVKPAPKKSKPVTDNRFDFSRKGKAPLPQLGLYVHRESAFSGKKITIDQQLQKIKNNYKIFADRVKLLQAEKLPSDTDPELLKLRHEIIGKAMLMLPLWAERIKYLEERNKKIKESAEQSYSRTEELQQLFMANHNAQKRGWRDKKDENSMRILELLRSPDVNPNAIVITQSAYNGAEVTLPLFEAVRITDHLSYKKEFLSCLISRHADPSSLTNGSFYNFSESNPLLAEYGLPDHALDVALYRMLLPHEKISSEEAARGLIPLVFDGARSAPAFFEKLIEFGNRETLVFLLAAGFNPNTKNGKGETPLFSTYRLPGKESLRQLLLAAGADPEIRDQAGKRADEYKLDDNIAVLWQKQDINGIKQFLEKGGNPDMSLPDGRTLLTDACHRRNVEMVRLLLTHKADPDKADSTGSKTAKFPIYAATQYLRQNKGGSHDRARELEILILLLKHGAKISRSDTGITSARGNIFCTLIVKSNERNKLFPILLPYYAKIDKELYWIGLSADLFKTIRKISRKNQLLFLNTVPTELLVKNFSIWMYHIQMDPAILQKALKNGLKINEKSYRDATPLYWAVPKQPFDVIEAMLKAGADPDITSSNGKRPIDRTRDKKIRNLLQKYSKRRR